MRSIFTLAALFLLLPLAALAQSAANPTQSDCSIASMSGSSQALGTSFTLGSHAYNRKDLLICNSSSVTGDTLAFNPAGGTAAIGGIGSVTLYPGACKEYSAGDSYLPPPPANNINVIGTSGQPVTCLEGK